MPQQTYPENTMNLTENSIISFAPDSGWEALFTIPGHEDPNLSMRGWTEPVIGWAVVVDLREDEEGPTETGMEPVLLVEDRYPVTLHWHMQGMTDPKVQVKIRRTTS